MVIRTALLWSSRLAGSAARSTSRGWLPVARLVVLVALALLVLPPLINAALDLAATLGVWEQLEMKEPSVGSWWTWERVLLVAAVLLTLRWFVRARERVIVEEFVDYTSQDATAVSGLAMLLVSELSRLRELYGRVNEELSTPLSVGARPGGARDHSSGEPGSFLSVRADEVTEVLSGAVASESKVTFAGITIPIGFVLSLVGRLARGPRVIGSVHLTDAGGGPTVTAQIVGRGSNFTWRVDAPPDRRRTADKAFLDPMVAEIACRMFTDMTLRGSVRWQAIQPFTEYLGLYWESLRTPKNRARFLKQAEDRLLAAVAEDETFDLAFYNLGVVYSQLAQAEYLAASTAEYPKRKTSDPRAAHDARMAAARTAFARAVTLNRGRWEAVYALAVHEFASARHNRQSPEAELRCIVQRCERVLELDRWNAQAYDLMGMAQFLLDEADDSVRSHARAVRRVWWRLCRSEYRERKQPPTTASVLPGARANAAAALHNLGHARYVSVVRRPPLRRRLGIARVDLVFHQALSLAPNSSKAAMELDRGRIREAEERDSAADSYRAAVRIEPDNPVYWAFLARAQAQQGHDDDALRSCRMALDALAPTYRRTLEPVCMGPVRASRDQTVRILRATYERLGRSQESERVGGLIGLADVIAPREGERPGWSELEDLLAATPEDDWWRREQIGLALARALGDAGEWKAAESQYARLIKELGERRPEAIRQHALHAKHAKALRRSEDKHGALASAARGLVLDPISPVTRRELGKAHFALLQYEEALEAWQHTLWLTPNDATLHWKVAFSLWSTAQDYHDAGARRQALTESAEAFERAAMLFGIESDTGWAWSRLWLGRVAHEMGDADAAMKHLRAAKGCKVTELPARILLAEVHQANDQGGLAWEQLTKVRVQLRAAVAEARRQKPESDARERYSDADWGDTLSYREIDVRLRLGLGRHALDVDGDERAAERHAAAAERLASGLAKQARARNRLRAHALELRSRVQLDRCELPAARETIGRAVHLCPEPALLLRRIEIAAAAAEGTARRTDRAHLVAGMLDDLRVIRRAEGDGGERAVAGGLLVGRWTPPATANGNGDGS